MLAFSLVARLPEHGHPVPDSAFLGRIRVVTFVVFWIVAVSASPTPNTQADEPIRISDARKHEQGWLVHTVTSPYQAGTTEIRVLVPDDLESQKPLNILYVLPVEAGDGRRWGDALAEVKRHDLPNRHRLVCVYPTFSHLPWYADHPTDPTIRQETYFLRVVVPFVERAYPVQQQADGRLLVGFSKSGWGAFSLLLRHPDVFGKAAAWDAPFDMAQPNRYGMDAIFGSQENFEHYRITTLLKQQAEVFSTGKRLIHLGYDNFRDHHVAVEKLITELGVSHEYRDGPRRPHAWDSGWLPEAVALLVE
jgi:esterase/lipase superfamily enzyme